MKKRKGVKHTKRHPLAKNWLWFYRKQMGYSQNMVATLLGQKSTARVSDYERGKRIPSLKTALKLEIILCTPIAFLYPEFYAHLKQEINQRRP